jgi:microcystin-dependent protein
MDAFIGEIRAFANSYYPDGWLPCDGSSQSISTYQALFAVIGTRFGGNGQTNFQLPDLRGSALVSAGQNPYGTNFPFAQARGTEQVTLTTTNNLPVHNHTFNGVTGGAPTAKLSIADNSTSFISNYGYLSAGAATVAPAYLTAPQTPVALNPTTISPAGGRNGVCSPHENRSPFVAINYYICATDGYYPQPQ